jgi:(2Fe-2S) ferredoxin
VAAQESGQKPFYRHHVFCCVNERPEGNARGCCKGRGGLGLRNYMKAKAKTLGLGDVRINSSGCLDRCELGPTMVVYPEGIWYRAENRSDIDEILGSHIQGGEPVGRLMLGRDE